MASTITDTLKKQLIQGIVDDVAGSDLYYVGIGRSQDWNDSDTTPAVYNSAYEQRNFRLNMQSIKNAETVSFVVPRNNWSAGTIYTAYDDNQVGYPTNAYYVLTSNNSVYICLEAGRDSNGTAVPSTVQPTGSSSTSFRTSDGYVWKFLYTLNATAASNFLSSNFMPIKLQGATDSDSPATDIEQKSIQDAAVLGEIGRIAITNAGTGYTSAPTVTISGNGTGASASATVFGGQVVAIKMDSDGSGNVEHGSGYDYATVTLSGVGSNATARAVLSPTLGFGGNPIDDLKSSAIMFNTKPEGTESGTFLVNQEFRQIGIIKDPLLGDSDGAFTDATGSTLKTLTLSAVTSAFTNDRIIEGGTSGAQAYVDSFDSDTIHFHQTETTGFVDFQASEVINEVSGSGSGTIGTINTPDVNPLSGELLYIENRAAIDRSADQTEDIKLVIQI